MSFAAAILYYNYSNGFNVLSLFADWLKLICFNFPFAFFTRLFFIQPLVRSIFKVLFRKDIAAHTAPEQMSKENVVKAA